MWGIPPQGLVVRAYHGTWHGVGSGGARPLKTEPEHLNALGECSQEKPGREGAKRKAQ